MKHPIQTAFCLLLCLVQLLSATAYAAVEDEAKNWYIPRSGQVQPALPRELSDALTYDAYYLDTSMGGEQADRVLYLTFDAGYENGNIEKILDVLHEEQVSGAFFILSYLCRTHPQLVKRMKEEGHLVCNHTKNHKDMTTLTEEEMKANLCSLEALYEQTTGYTMDKYFRFPEGHFNIQTLRCAQSLGYKTVFWSFGYEDWDNNRQMSESAAIKKIIANTHNGAVILLHPTSATNAAILPTLIKQWRAMGYRFGTLDELCCHVDAQRGHA